MFLGITFIAKAYDLERDGIYYVITHEDEDLYDYFNYEGPHENFPRDEDGNWMFGDPNNGTVGVTNGEVSYTGYVSIPDSSVIWIHCQCHLNSKICIYKSHRFDRYQYGRNRFNLRSCFLWLLWFNSSQF